MGQALGKDRDRPQLAEQVKLAREEVKEVQARRRKIQGLPKDVPKNSEHDARASATELNGDPRDGQECTTDMTDEEQIQLIVMNALLTKVVDAMTRLDNSRTRTNELISEPGEAHGGARGRVHGSA